MTREDGGGRSVGGGVRRMEEGGSRSKEDVGEWRDEGRGRRHIGKREERGDMRVEGVGNREQEAGSREE